MTKLKTVAAQEDFIVEMNGDYNIPFDEVQLEAKVVGGEVFTVGEGVGIAAKAGEIGDWMRVMVRGNPTTVNAQALTGLDAENTKQLAAQGIIVVNA